MAKPFLVSDESINCYGIRLLTTGGITTAFTLNPTMLFMHERGRVIGMWENLRVENGAWHADAVFDMDDPYAAGIGGKVERGFLKACSVGVNVLEYVWNDELGCADAVRWELLEISIVDRGGNINAVCLMDANGERLSELQLSERLAQFKPVPAAPVETIESSINPPKPMALELLALATAMGLSATATEHDVMTLAGEIKSESTARTELAQLKATIRQAEALNLTDAAVADGRISAVQKDDYLALFDLDHDKAKSIVSKLQAPKNLVTLAATGQVDTAKTDEEAAKLYDQKDRAGTLVQLQAANPDEFNKLYKAKHGVDFKK